MRLFFKNLILFGIYSIAFYIVALLFVGEFLPKGINNNLLYRVSEGHSYFRIKELQRTKNIDILILGSSKAYRGYDTRVFKDKGITSFNLGSSAQSFAQTELLLKRYLDSLNPKMVIYDVNPGLFPGYGVWSSLDLISYDSPGLDWTKLILRQNDIRLYNTYIFAVYDRFIKNETYTEDKTKLEIDKYIPGGHIETSSTDFKDNGLNTPYNIDIIDFQLNAFKSSINILKEHNVPFVLVQSPTTAEQNDVILNRRSFDSLFGTYGPYLNYNNKMKLDRSFFKDHGHLNAKGSSKFSNLLIENLRELNLYP